MKKTTIKKVLALVVGVLIIAASLTTAFGAFAAAPADSEADYYVGIKSAQVQYPHHLKPVDSVPVFDFEDEFRYWAGGKDKNNTAPEAFELVTENGNSYIKVPETGYASNMLSALFKIENVEYGDEIVLLYDVKGKDADVVRINLQQHYVKVIAAYDETTGMNITKKADGVNLINCTPGVPHILVGSAVEPAEFDANLGADGWTTMIGASSNKVNDPIAKGQSHTTDTLRTDVYAALTITGGDADVAVGTKLDVAFDNIRICKVTGEGDDKVYTDLSTNTVVYPEPKYPAYLGTADKGFDSTTVASYKLKPLDGVFENLDFSDGFIGWAGRNNGGTDVYASDCYDLVTDGDNKYVKVKDSGYVTSMRSAVFSVDGIAAGDSVTVLYDVKGNDGGAFHIALRQIVMKAGVAYDAVTGQAAEKVYVSDHNVVGSGVAASDFDVNLGADGWTTRAGYKNVKVQELDPEGSDKYYLQMIVTCGDAGYAVAGDKLDAAIDNLRIAKVVDGVYTNVADGSVIYDPNAPVGGGDDNQGGNGTGNGNGGSATTGDSVLALAALFFVSGAAVFGTAKAMKNR